jgi:Bacterial protein of unknown function (Gcw_chp)
MRKMDRLNNRSKRKGAGSMKKVVLSVVAALAFSAAPALAADMPAKAPKVAPAAAPSPWDVAFGTAFTTDYVLRGVSQSNHKPAAQGYFELDYTATIIRAVITRLAAFSTAAGSKAMPSRRTSSPIG